MKKYYVELISVVNKNYKLLIQAFNVSAIDMDSALKQSIELIKNHMLNEDDYYVAEINDTYCEFSFGDAETGQDVLYTIKLS